MELGPFVEGAEDDIGLLSFTQKGENLPPILSEKATEPQSLD